MLFIRKLLTLLGVITVLIPVVGQSAEFTDDELAWLKAHPVIRYAPAPNYPPVEYFDEQRRHRGITADLLAQLQDTYGLPIKIERYPTWDAVMMATRNGDVDLLGSVALTPERQQFLTFTDAYIEIPTVIFTRKSEAGRKLTLSDLVGKRVVVIESYASTEFLEQNYPEIKMITVPDIETGLRMVSYGLADAIITSQVAAIFYIEKHRLFNLTQVGETEVVWHLRFATRKEWPELASILQKALDALPAADKEQLFQRWMKLEYPQQLLDQKQVNLLLWVLALLVFLALLFWNFVQGKRLRGHAYSLEEALEHKHELERQLARLQMIDPVTGITNRRGWLNEATHELGRYHRYGSGFAVVLIELKGYRALQQNPELGSAEEALRLVVSILTSELREHDLFGKLGERHLALLIQNVDQEHVAQVIERIAYAVEQEAFTLSTETAIPLTLLFGVATPRSTTGSIEELLQQAELQLHSRKAA